MYKNSTRNFHLQIPSTEYITRLCGRSTLNLIHVYNSNCNYSDNSFQILLTWPNSEVVFEFFKPAALPTFEDKTNTVTSEVCLQIK